MVWYILQSEKYGTNTNNTVVDKDKWNELNKI